MFDDFIIRALFAGVGVAIVAGAVGCFVVWRRMAYFGDSLAHSALLGVALGLSIGLQVNVSIIVISLFFALLLLWLEQKRILATDTLLGILAHAMLSIGIIAISLLDQRIDLHTYLFGDILTITTYELIFIYGGGVLVLIILWKYWSSLILTTISEDLAKAEGVNILMMRVIIIIVMTIVVASSLRTVGILLITSLLIIPAATARQLSRSPEVMAIFASLLGSLAVIIGVYSSLEFDTPSGPSIVVAATIIFAIVLPFSLVLYKSK